MHKKKKIESRTEETNIQYVSIKAPEFIETAVNDWFSILKAQFHLQNVMASVTKFFMVIASSPAETIVKILLFILESQNYEELKCTLIEEYERIKLELLYKLMPVTKIKGQPSIYLQQLLSIANLGLETK